MADKKVTSPLPGKVKKVLVSAGQKVAMKEAVVVIEAMKMENQIYSNAAGTVKEVYVKEGQAVRAGAELISIEA